MNNCTQLFLLLIVSLSLHLTFAETATAQETTGDDEFPWEVETELPIEISGGGVARVLDPIAIPDAVPDNSLARKHPEIAREITEVLRFDTTISGLYRVMDASSFFFDTSKEGNTVESINFSNWNGVNAKALIKANFKMRGDARKPDSLRVWLDLRFFLVDTQKLVELNWKPREVPTAKVRDSVHDFMNAVVEKHLGALGPFGTRLAITARTNSNKQIYTMDMDGFDVRRVTKNNAINILPSWGPGGVFFTSYQDGNPNLYLMASGKQRIISAKPGQNTGASYCGDKVAITLSMGGTNTDIYLINPRSGSIITRLTEHWGIDTSPSFSPDCSKIAFVSDRAGGPQIYITSARGGEEPRRLTHAGGYNSTPDWSPKGNMIAFTGFTGGRHDIFVVDLQGYIQRLTSGQGSNENPTWSPNGNYIAFTSSRGGGVPQLFIMTSDGFTQTRITSQGGFEAPSWRRR